MAIILKSTSKWVGTDVELDITDWYNDSGCESIDEFMEKNDDELFNQACENQGIEYSVREE
jgi:hypothetical protein